MDKNHILIPCKTFLIPPDLNNKGEKGIKVKETEEGFVCGEEGCHSCCDNCKKCSSCLKDFYWKNLPEEWKD